MQNVLKIGVIASVTLAWIGCADVSSTDVLTSGVYADLALTATGDGTSKASAILRVGGPFSMTFLDLEGDDELVAMVGEEAQVLQETSLGSIHSYSVTLGMDTAGEEVVVAFERTLDAGAPNSVMTLPPAFDLGEADESFDRAQGFTVTWEPVESENDMSVDIDGSCVESYGESLGSDPGTFTLSPDALQADEDAQGESCTVTVAIRRSLVGTLDAGYGEGGSATGYQVREAQILSEP
jgi:hypothetical protein